MTIKNRATFLLTPPQREAVIELARAFNFYSYSITYGSDRKIRAEAARRLLNAQDALGIQLERTDTLQFYIDRESEAA